VALFVLTAAEASAFIGIFVPGEVALLLGGYLAWRGELELWGVVVAAIAGAVIGDSLGYEIGRHLGPRLRQGRLGSWVGEDRWDRARRSVDDHGPQAVLIGRFVGVLRAVVPAVVGDARMPYRQFLLWNVLGAATWTPAVVVAGYVAGNAYEQVARWAGPVSAGLLVAVVVAGLLVRHHRRSQHR
jgi:membrane protein DedA with SNARE-associated domain